MIGHYIDERTGEVATIAYRMPEPKQRGKAGGGATVASDAAGNGEDGDAAPPARAWPDVTQKGIAMIGDLRTDALHQALAKGPIEDDTLLGLLVLAFGCNNVAVDSGSGQGKQDRRAICQAIAEGGVLTADLDLLRQSARQMLIAVLSCRDNRSQSGPFALIAGEAIGASHCLPNMATEAFLSCLSRNTLETAARDAGVNVAPRAKDTRSRLVSHFQEGTFIYPGALFRLTSAEQQALAERAGTGHGWDDPLDSGAGDEDGGPDADPNPGEEAGDTAGPGEEPAEQEAA